jgi:predicted DNA-binding ribbon-helix-helix protein
MENIYSSKKEHKKKRGRPKKGLYSIYSKRVSVNLTCHLFEVLKRLSEKTDKSISALIRDILKQHRKEGRLKPPVTIRISLTPNSEPEKPLNT